MRRLTRLGAGMYADATSIRAVVAIAAGRKEKRFALGTPLRDVKRWRNQTKVKLEALHPQRRAGAMGRGTFNAAIRKHLKTLAIVSWKSRRSELRAWAAAGLGRLKRARITSDHVKGIVKHWHDGDATADPPRAAVPPKTIQNRVRALTAMYHDLDGEDAWTPADDVKLPAVPKRHPDYVGIDRIIAVEHTLRQQEESGGLDAKWRARYMVMAATGQRPVFVKRAQLADVNVATREWRIHATKGGNPIRLPLNGDMVAAWAHFIKVEAWGTFDGKKYAEIVRAAGWPSAARPYATKHSLSQDLADADVDLETIADWHGHTGGFKTTRIYTGFAWRKLKLASEAIEGRLGWGSPKPSALPGNLAVDLGAMNDAERRTLLKALLNSL